MTKTLLIGCGGTGIKSLISFNRQMAGDPEKRYKMWEDVSYLIIDTDRADISKFEEGIAEGMEAVSGRNIRPIIKTIHITKSNTLLNDIVHKYIVKQTDTEILSDLHKHWWFSPDNVPYTALHRRDIGFGAAQCPPISYMFMWDYLPKLEKVIDSLLNEINDRNNEEKDPLEDLQVYLIAGMSGGTGRGTWNLVAFKVRECILKRVPSARVDLPAIFLDSSCYTALSTNSSAETISKQVNSLTGYSELSAWLSIRDIQSCYDYSLPKLIPPNSGKVRSFAINVNSSTNDSYFQSPVRYAYLIFGENGRQRLYVGRGRNEYCEMVGVALYALVAHSHQFNSDFCNEMLKLGSFGAVSAEVETVELRKFFNSELRRVKIEELRAKIGDFDKDLYSKQLGKDFHLRQNELVDEDYLRNLSDEILEESKKNTATTEEESKIAISEKKGDIPDIIKTLMNKVKAQKTKLVADKLRVNIFKKQKLSDAKREIENVLKLAKKDTNKIAQEALNNLLVEWTAFDLDGQNEAIQKEVSEYEKRILAKPLTNYLWNIVLKAYRFDNKISVARAIYCIDLLITYIKESINNICELIDGEAALNKKCKDYAVNQFLFEDWKLFPDPFNEKEMDDIIKDLMQVYDNKIYLCIRKPLLNLLNDALDTLEAWKAVFKIINDTLESVAKKFEFDANLNCTGRETEDAYNKLFVKTDMNSIDASIPSGTETSKQIRRIFKPIMSRDDIKTLLSDKELSYVGAGTIEAFIKEVFCQILVKAKCSPTDDDLEKLRYSLYELFKANVSVKRDKLDAKFTLEEVLHRNIFYWNQKLDEAYNRDHDAVRELQGRFRTYLGLRDDETDRSKYDYIRTEKGVPHMLFDQDQAAEGNGPAGVINRLPVSLMNNCKPWMLFDCADETLGVENLQQVLLLPYHLSLAVRENIKIETWRGPTEEGANTIIDPFDPPGKYNPKDRMVAFSSFYVPIESADNKLFDRIISIQSDLNDPAVKQRLTLAESPSGKGYLGYYEPMPEELKESTKLNFKERYIGLGYVSPIFLEEPKLANRRWCPWKDDIVAEEEKVRSDKLVYEVLAYAFTCSGLDPNSPEVSEISGEGWSLPLLSRTSRAQTRKSGKFLFVREALGVPSNEVCEWDAKDPLPCVGITQIVNWLTGKGIPDANGHVDSRVTEEGIKVFKRMVAEKLFFEKNILPKFKPAVWKNIVDKRKEWLEQEVKNRAAILECDRETWRKIYVAADLL